MTQSAGLIRNLRRCRTFQLPELAVRDAGRGSEALPGRVRAARDPLRRDPRGRRLHQVRPVVRALHPRDGRQPRVLRRLVRPLPADDGGLQAGGNPSETGTWNAPGPIDTQKANVNLGRVLQPLAISLDLERDSKSGSTSAMSAVENYISEAYKAAARIENDELHGGTNAIGTGTDSSLLAAVTSATGSPGLVDPGRHRRELRPAHPGPRRRHPHPLDRREPRQRAAPQDPRCRGRPARSRSTRTSSPPTALGQRHVLRERRDLHPGLVRATGCSRSRRPSPRPARSRGSRRRRCRQWQGVDATPASAQALSDAVLDNAVYLLRGNGVGASDFGIAHPKVVDLYKQSKAATDAPRPEGGRRPGRVRRHRVPGRRPAVPDPQGSGGAARRLPADRPRRAPLYGDHVGPAFIDDDGAMWRFFSRNFFKEGDLYDRVQLAVKACNKLATIGNATTQLTEAQ
jgi:hypothetical protein